MRVRRGEPMAWLRQQLRGNGSMCAIWPFGQSHGYGAIRHNGRTWHAHRLVCLMAHGEPSANQTDVAHSCGNRLCCNPNHLRHATSAENQRDKIVHGTMPHGEGHSGSKLNESDVRKIKRDIGRRSMKQIAEDHGVSVNAIYLIKKGVNWRHVQ